MRCLTISSNFALDMDRLIEHFQAQGDSVTLYRRVLHKNHTGDVFFFPYGVIVCWGMEKQDETNLISLLRDFQSEPLGAAARDTHEYLVGDTATIKNDIITLPDDKVLTKLAFSHALAQSVKLSGFELTVLKSTEATRHIPHTLAQKGKIKLSRKETRSLMGRLMVEKNAVNLHLEFINTPKFFWNHPELEPYYSLAIDYVDFDSRVSTLNKRLEVMHELYDMLNSELNNQHSSLLEWIIIALISFEVSLSLSIHVFHWL
jgi:uncharacterized Rmd1/YagE family protein